MKETPTAPLLPFNTKIKATCIIVLTTLNNVEKLQSTKNTENEKKIYLTE